MAEDSPTGVRTMGAMTGGVKAAEENGPEAAGAVHAEVTGGTVVVGAEEDMIDLEIADTRLIGNRILPGLGHRLYRWKEEGQRAGRVCERTGVVVAQKEKEAVAQGGGYGLRTPTPEGVGNKYVYCLSQYVAL
jgi:hypothetical protein